MPRTPRSPRAPAGHLILLLGMGQTWLTITSLLFCNTRIDDWWERRFLDVAAHRIVTGCEKDVGPRHDDTTDE